MEHLNYSNESAEYRAARNALLDEEIALRAQIEAVAAKRRALPLGGEVREDHVFERIGKTSMPEKVRLSELFGPHDTLVLYSFMYGPERELPCPGCTHLLDDRPARGLGAPTRLETPFAVVDGRQQLRRRLLWRHVQLFKGDARAASRAGRRELGRNNIQRLQKEERRDQTFLGLGDELCPAGAQTAPSRRRYGRPLWGLLDMTPEGRDDFFPKVNYE